MSAFEEIGICPEIIQAIEEDDWLLPTPVQQEAVPLVLTGGDVLAAAETGSGKTGAFGLPCLQIVHETLRGKCALSQAPVAAQRCILASTDKDQTVKLGQDGLECSCEEERKWTGVRATTDLIGGRYMYEVEVVEGIVRVGWSSWNARLELGMEAQSFGYGSTGKKSWDKKFEDYGETFQGGDIIGCLLDRMDGSISYLKNGKDLGVAYKLSPDMAKVGLRPHVTGKGFRCICKFDGPLEYQVDGYVPVGEADPKHVKHMSAEVGRGRPPMCLILEPTRELADQTMKCMSKFSKYLDDPGVSLALLVGGVEEEEQTRKLEAGVDIVVGTLQKVMDLIRRQLLDVSKVRFFVLDEADDLQKKDERRDIPGLNSQIKNNRRDRVQTLLFSATLHTPEVHSMIEELTTQATWVDLKGKDAVPDTVHHVVYHVDPTEDLQWSGKELAVHAKVPEATPVTDGVHARPSQSEIDRPFQEALRHSEKIKSYKPSLVVKIADELKMTQCMVFCRTNIDCNNLEAYLCALNGSKPFKGKMESGKENPYSCVVLAGMRNQGDRKMALEAFKEGDVRFLISTDVGARGLDIVGLPYVLQMSLSDDIENYVHRIGRCGRADRMGLAISLAAKKKEKVWYHKCPTKGKNCGNTKLTIPYLNQTQKLREEDKENWIVDEGGCCTWFNEPDILEKIEERIHMSLEVMDPVKFSVPGILGDDQKTEEGEPPSRRQLKRRPEAGSTAVVYGGKRKSSQESGSKQVRALGPTVKELSALERHVQQLFGSILCSDGGGGDALKNVGVEEKKTTPKEGEEKRPAASGWATGAAKKKRKAHW